MIIRMLTLLVLVAQMKLNTIDASDSDDEHEQMGGQGFANVVSFVVLLGVLSLAVLIIYAVLSLTGQFDMDLIDPEV